MWPLSATFLKRDFNNYEIARKLSTKTTEVRRVVTLLSCNREDIMNAFDGFDMSDENRKNLRDT